MGNVICGRWCIHAIVEWFVWRFLLVWLANVQNIWSWPLLGLAFLWKGWGNVGFAVLCTPSIAEPVIFLAAVNAEHHLWYTVISWISMHKASHLSLCLWHTTRTCIYTDCLHLCSYWVVNICTSHSGMQVEELCPFPVFFFLISWLCQHPSWICQISTLVF